MTISTVTADNPLEAWASASNHLLAIPGSHECNLIVEISQPAQWSANWFRKIDPRTVHTKGENPSNVANTIFPAATWRRSKSRADFYSNYLRAHARSRNRRWGTYFQRLIEFGPSRMNQLERAIEVLNTWEKEPGTAIVFHLSSAETDRPQPLGGPCLQLCQLQAWDGKIDMTAVYRNHDYFNKALPNFVGLGRLLDFICSESGRDVGKLVCHSGHAYFSKSRAAAVSLIARV